MSTIIKILRSLVKGKRPTGRSEGEVWVNEADKQFGFIDSTGAAQDLLAVRRFSATSDYAIGDIVMQAGKLYRATKAVTAGAFTAADWDALPANDKYLPLTGGTLTGALGIGTTALTGYNLNINRKLAGAAKAVSIRNVYVVGADVITSAISYVSQPTTEAAAYTLDSAVAYLADGVVVGAGSAVTNQRGLHVNNFTGAANNYAVSTNVPVGTNNNWNFYAQGTAPNYMAGPLGIGTTVVAGCNLRLTRQLTGSTTVASVQSAATVSGDVSVSAYGFSSLINTDAAVFTLPEIYHFAARGGAVGAGSTVATQYGFFAGQGLSGADSNIGFLANIKEKGTQDWNFYAKSAAPNAYAGKSSFGAVTVPTETIDATGNIAATGSMLSSGNADGVGYKTGAGGTTTQATSRTTGVTLNAVCGSIVLAPAAGLATYQTFTVRNVVVADTDVVHVSQKSGTDKYIVMVTRVAAGAFDVTFATTGGTTTEQPEFNFAIMRAVAA
jgi:hypothetical protein